MNTLVLLQVVPSPAGQWDVGWALCTYSACPHCTGSHEGMLPSKSALARHTRCAESQSLPAFSTVNGGLLDWHLVLTCPAGQPNSSACCEWRGEGVGAKEWERAARKKGGWAGEHENKQRNIKAKKANKQK